MRDPDREVGTIYSNADHELDEGVAAELRLDPGACAGHAAWDHYGYVYYEDGVWHEEVMQHKAVVATLSDPDLDALIDRVNERFGFR